MANKAEVVAVNRLDLAKKTLKKSQAAILRDNLAPDPPSIQNNHISNPEDYHFQSSLPTTEVATSDSADDIPSTGFTTYSNNTTDWGELPPSNRIRQVRQGIKPGGHGLMSLSMPVPSMTGNSQNEESRYIAELYVGSQ